MRGDHIKIFNWRIVPFALIAALTLVSCGGTTEDSTPAGLGISLQDVRDEFSYFDFTFHPPVDGRGWVLARRFPEITEYAGEVVELFLFDPRNNLSMAQVLFATQVDHFDSGDAGWFIDMVAPEANAMKWVRDGDRVKWGIWSGFQDIAGKKGNVYIQVERIYAEDSNRTYFDTAAQEWKPLSMVLVTLTPR